MMVTKIVLLLQNRVFWRFTKFRDGYIFPELDFRFFGWTFSKLRIGCFEQNVPFGSIWGAGAAVAHLHRRIKKCYILRSSPKFVFSFVS